MLKLDIRVKILVLILANILMFKMMTLNLHLVIAVLFTLYLGVNSSFRRMMNLFLIYMFFTVYEM